MANRTISLDIPEEMTEQFDELARARGLGRDHLMMDALREYLEGELEERRRIRASIGEIERGEFVPVEAIEAEELAWLESQGFTPGEMAVIDRAVDDEGQDFEEAVQAVREGYEDVTAGRTRPAAEFIAEMRLKYGLPR
jgi:predicted transcriptional regulator